MVTVDLVVRAEVDALEEEEEEEDDDTEEVADEADEDGPEEEAEPALVLRRPSFLSQSCGVAVADAVRRRRLPGFW